MIKIEITITRRQIYLVAGLILVAAVLMPAAGWAASGFTDVPDSNVFKDDIAWLANSGVTLGCNPPQNDRYCPADTVNREQMAAFLHRLAANQVVDAATVQGFAPEDLMTGEPGPQGPEGPPGPTGPEGLPGPALDLANIYRSTSQSVIVGYATCLSGDLAIGGGYSWGVTDTQNVTQAGLASTSYGSYPNSYQARNMATADVPPDLWVYCLDL